MVKRTRPVQVVALLLVVTGAACAGPRGGQQVSPAKGPASTTSSRPQGQPPRPQVPVEFSNERFREEVHRELGAEAGKA